MECLLILFEPAFEFCGSFALSSNPPEVVGSYLLSLSSLAWLWLSALESISQDRVHFKFHRRFRVDWLLRFKYWRRFFALTLILPLNDLIYLTGRLSYSYPSIWELHSPLAALNSLRSVSEYWKPLTSCSLVTVPISLWVWTLSDSLSLIGTNTAPKPKG